MIDDVKKLGEPLTMGQLRGMRDKGAWIAYSTKPVTIDLEEWTTHWVEKERHAGGFHEETGRIVPSPGMLSEEKVTVLVDGRHKYKGLYCAKCGAAAADTFLDICPRCGRAATTEGLDMLEKRLGGVSGLKLKDCTKAELLWVIDHMKKNSFGAIDHSIRNALADLEYKREMDRMDQAKQFEDTARKARMEYMELLNPYEGKKLTDIPLNVLKKADEAMNRARCADKKWYRLMGIKM